MKTFIIQKALVSTLFILMVFVNLREQTIDKSAIGAMKSKVPDSIMGRDSSQTQFSPQQSPNLVMQTGHAGEITAVAVSPDGKLIATGSTDRSIKLWDVASGRELRTFGPGPYFVLSLAFSHDGQYLASGTGYASEHDFSSILQVWNVASGQMLWAHKAPSDAAVYALGFLSGDRRLRTCESSSITDWDARTGKKLKQVKPKASWAPYAVYFSPDMRRLLGAGPTSNMSVTEIWPRPIQIVSSDDIGGMKITEQKLMQADGKWVEFKSGQNKSQATLWTAANGNNLSIKKHSSPLSSLAYSQDGRHVAIGGMDGGVTLIDIETHKPIKTWRTNKGPITALAIRPGGTVAAACSDNVIRILNTASKDGPVLSGHSRIIRHLIFDSNDNFLVSGSDDAVTAIWDIKRGRAIHGLMNLNLRSHNSCISNNSNNIALANNDNSVTIWHMDKGSRTLITIPQASIAEYLAFSPDEHMFACVERARDGDTLSLWDGNTGNLIHRYTEPGRIASFAFSNDNKKIAISYASKNIYIWSLSDSSPVTTFQGISGELSFSKNDSQVRIIDNNQPVITWVDLLSGKTSRTIHIETPGYIDISDDNSTIMTFSSGYPAATIFFCDPLSGKERFHKEVLDGKFAYLSQDGKYAISGSVYSSTEAGAEVLDAKSGKVIFQRRLSSGVNLISVDRNSKYIAIGKWNGNISLFELGTKEYLGDLRGHVGRVSLVNVDMTTHQLLSVGSDGSVRLWQIGRQSELVAGLYTLFDRSWAIVAPDGRFDTSNPDQIQGLHWIMPDDPFMPMSPEVFSRNYFEPNLWPRLLAHDPRLVTQVPTLTSLNRVQPRVTITDIRPDGHDTNGQETAAVTVRVESISRTLSNGHRLTSGAKDLRLFRDGQLIRASPDTKDGGSLDKDTTVIVKRANPDIVTYTKVFSHIPLPNRPEIKEVVFTAYAFNTSDVKSRTSVPFGVILSR